MAWLVIQIRLEKEEFQNLVDQDLFLFESHKKILISFFIKAKYKETAIILEGSQCQNQSFFVSGVIKDDLAFVWSETFLETGYTA